MCILWESWRISVFPSQPPLAGGWKALSNGDLVAAAVAGAFECLLTRNQLSGESAAHALGAFPQFAVVVVNLPQQPSQQYRDRFLAAWAESPIRPIGGRLIRCP